MFTCSCNRLREHTFQISGGVVVKINPLFKCSYRLLVVAAAAMILLAPTAVHAQRYLGAISGVISDPSGAKVAGAKVTATEGATKFATAVQTSGAGTYNMPALQPGT